jgi:ATP-dependent DNA helicase RecG
MDRLYADKGSFSWELKVRNVGVAKVNEDKAQRLYAMIRSSERVTQFVKNKSDREILDHFHLASDGKLTNLGILWVGSRGDRARLTYPPAIQFIKYDEQDRKIKKMTWTDSELNPLELVETIWSQVDDWREFYEFPDGIFRQIIPHYEETVVRELLVNALIHRPYNIRGDIYINMYPDRLEITNPGRLPIGVTPQNILHTRQHRNGELCNLCYFLKLMEKEGSGYDMIYEKLVSAGKLVPIVIEGIDSVTVIVYKKVIDNRIVDLLEYADQRIELTQREKITLGIIAQNESISVLDLVKQLDLDNAKELSGWIGKLKTKDILKVTSRTKGATYQLNPDFIQSVGYKGKTTLKGIERHRLRELIVTDLERYKISSINEIHERIGKEIPIRRIRTELRSMVSDGIIQARGIKRGRKYLIENNTPMS